MVVKIKITRLIIVKVVLSLSDFLLLNRAAELNRQESWTWTSNRIFFPLAFFSHFLLHLTIKITTTVPELRNATAVTDEGGDRLDSKPRRRSLHL